MARELRRGSRDHRWHSRIDEMEVLEPDASVLVQSEPPCFQLVRKGTQPFSERGCNHLERPTTRVVELEYLTGCAAGTGVRVDDQHVPICVRERQPAWAPPSVTLDPLVLGQLAAAGIVHPVDLTARPPRIGNCTRWQQ